MSTPHWVSHACHPLVSTQPPARHGIVCRSRKAKASKCKLLENHNANSIVQTSGNNTSTSDLSCSGTETARAAPHAALPKNPSQVLFGDLIQQPSTTRTMRKHLTYHLACPQRVQAGVDTLLQFKNQGGWCVVKPRKFTQALDLKSMRTSVRQFQESPPNQLLSKQPWQNLFQAGTIKKGLVLFFFCTLKQLVSTAARSASRREHHAQRIGRRLGPIGSASAKT